MTRSEVMSMVKENVQSASVGESAAFVSGATTEMLINMLFDEIEHPGSTRRVIEQRQASRAAFARR